MALSWKGKRCGTGFTYHRSKGFGWREKNVCCSESLSFTSPCVGVCEPYCNYLVLEEERERSLDVYRNMRKRCWPIQNLWINCLMKLLMEWQAICIAWIICINLDWNIIIGNVICKLLWKWWRDNTILSIHLMYLFVHCVNINLKKTTLFVWCLIQMLLGWTLIIFLLM